MGWIASILSIISVILIGYKKRIGFIFTIFGNIAWIYLGVQTKIPSLCFINILMIGINTWNWIKWGRDKEL